MTKDIYGPLDLDGENSNWCRSTREVIDALLAEKPLSNGPFEVGPMDRLLVNALVLMTVPVVRTIDTGSTDDAEAALLRMQHKVMQQLMAVMAQLLINPNVLETPEFTRLRVTTEKELLLILNTWLAGCMKLEKGEQNA